MRLIYFFIFCCFISCSLNDKKLEKKMIDRDDFKLILIDMFSQDSSSVMVDNDIILSDDLTSKHNITKDDFNITLDYYLSNAEDLEKLINEIEDALFLSEIN